ncbi:MAG TPA: hypothetical protein VGE88_19090 [Lysobacter sp.]
MNRRDEFAAASLQGLRAAGADLPSKAVAELAVFDADALLEMLASRHGAREFYLVVDKTGAPWSLCRDVHEATRTAAENADNTVIHVREVLP